MVHVLVLEAYIHSVLMFIADYIILLLPIQDLINEYGETTMPFKLATCMKPSILHLHVLFCPCVVRKATAHVGTKVFNMHQQAQKSFCGIFVAIPQHQNRVSCLCTTW